MQEEHMLAISSGTIIRALLIGAGFWALWFLRDIFLIVLAAIVLASAVEPAIIALARRGMPRLIALVTVYLGAIALVLLMLYLFVPAFLEDVNILLRALPKGVSVDAFLFGSDAVGHTIFGSGQSASLLDLLTKNIASGGLIQTFTRFSGGLISFVLVLVLSFYLAAQEHGIESFLRLVSPARKAGYVVGLWYRSQTKIGLWFQGQIYLGLIVGAIAFVGLLLLGVKSAFFLAVTIMFLEIIPVFGPVLAAIPAVAIAYTSGINFAHDGGFIAAFIVAMFYTILQQVESHLIYPHVVRKVIGIPPVLVILSLAIGAKVAGLLGLLLAVPVMAVVMEYLTDLAREKRVEEHIQNRLSEEEA
jgi:predicted PurR-regulated permease PerM